MKRIAMCLLFLLAVSTFCGCTVKYTEYNPTGERFLLVLKEGENRIYVDTETGVMYLYGNGLTVMVDADGKPLIWEGN